MNERELTFQPVFGNFNNSRSSVESRRMSPPEPLRNLSLFGCFASDPFTLSGLYPRGDCVLLTAELPPEAFHDTSDTQGRMGVRLPESSGGVHTTELTPPVASPQRPERLRRRPTQNRLERLENKSNKWELPAIGAIIDKFRIEELLGTGGFAAVYRATHLLLRVPVALKMLRPEVISREPEMADLLCEEARFTAQLNHPNVVRVFDVTHDEEMTYIVMEYIDGISLASQIDLFGRLHALPVLRMGIEICAGLRAALKQGLIHRDIKPANILVSKQGGIAKIVDLGLAQRIAAENPTQLDDLPIGHDSSIVGTPLYMSPEQASQPEDVDFRSDIYSLGATLYHAAVGVPPFSAESSLALSVKHHHAPFPHPKDKVPGFPEELSGLLEWMLQKNQDSRPASYEELILACDEAIRVLCEKDGVPASVYQRGPLFVTGRAQKAY